MSFILDALKKSENDRQRQSGPALFEMKMAKPRSSLPTWALALAALLVVNLGVVAWLMFRKPATAAVPPMPVAAAPTVTPPPVQTQQQPQYSPPPAAMNQQMPMNQGQMPQPYQGPPPGQQNNSQQNYPQQNYQQQNYQQPNYPQQNYQGQGQQQNPQQDFSQNPNQLNSGGQSNSGGQFNSNGVGQPGPSLDERVAQANAAEGSGGNPDDYAPAQEPSGEAPLGHVRRGLDNGLMTYQEAATKATIPPLRLDLHVYAPDPRKRFVLVNMKRLTEGQSTPEGVKVDSITTDGAVMSYRGVQFMMERD